MISDEALIISSPAPFYQFVSEYFNVRGKQIPTTYWHISTWDVISIENLGYMA